MEFFLFLVAGAIIIWFAVRIAKLSDTSTKVEQMDRELDPLRGRVAMLEERSIATPRNEESRPQTTAVRSELHIQSVKPAPAVPPPSPARVQLPLTPVSPPAATPVPPRQLSPIHLEAFAANAGNSAAAGEVDAAPSKRAISLEERVGQNWLNKLGIIALVTGLALLLGYQVRNLGPVGKSCMGLVISGAILITGLLLERRNRYRTFARATIGGGWALLFFVTFALFHVTAMQVLHSQIVDLVLMLAVASAMVIHSLRYRSQVVTSLAFLLGFLTVAISHVTIFSLVAGAILASGLLAVSFRQRWFALALGGLIAVYSTHALWLHRVLPQGATPGHPFPAFLPSAALLLFYWLAFRLFYIFRVPENNGQRVCSTLNVLLNSAGLLTLLKFQSSHPEWAFRGLLALGAAELVLSLIARRRHHQAFVALACIASLFLVAAVPFHFAGTSWSLTWLLESELLFITGLALRESVFRRLGVVSAFASVAQLIVVTVVPVFNLRQRAPDTNHHAVPALAFGCAALAAWFNSEFATRRWPHIVAEAFDEVALVILSYTAALCAAVTAWLALAGPLTLLPWLAIALLLAVVSSRLRSENLAQQVDLINLAVILRAAIINFAQWDLLAGSPRTVILLVAAALLYLNMRRRQPAHVLDENAIAPTYAWVATGVLATLAWYALQPAAVAVAWALIATILLEVGLSKHKPFLRHQAYVLLAASFARLFFINIALASTPRMETILPLAALFAWTYQRLYANEHSGFLDRFAGAANSWFALGTVVTLLFFSIRPAWVAIGGAALAVVLLLLARAFRRPLFSAQAITLLLLTAARIVAFNILSPEPLGAGFRESRIFTAGLPCLLLFAALPIAFSLRKQAKILSGSTPSPLQVFLLHPEQFFFFAPLAVLFVLVPAQLHGGIITVGWSVLGLLTFLFALVVRERSFRLAGLGVLLVGVGKVVMVDIWHTSPTDRYIALIVIGGALLFVSFLYSRYRETILELL